ncbi:hypothetical protein [Arthrobacter sp. HMWF013]|nr:hypothetical protein [Arthrobacter sp. HMWF013]
MLAERIPDELPKVRQSLTAFPAVVHVVASQVVAAVLTVVAD